MSGRRAVISLQQIRRLDRVCAFAAQDGARQGTHAPLGCSEPVGQTRMKVWGGEPVVDQREGGNSHHDRSAAVYAGVEYARRRVDLRHRDQGDGVAGQDGAVRPVAIQKTTDVDAKPEPSRECQHEQLARLCEQPGYRKGRDHPDDGAEDPVDGLLVGLSARLQGENADGTAADEALSSCSQNAAYSATIMAAQMRSAKPRRERKRRWPPDDGYFPRELRLVAECMRRRQGETAKRLVKGLRRSSCDAAY